MTTKQELESALKDAMRANDDLGKRTLRLALSAIRLVEVEKGTQMDEHGVMAVLQKEIKSRQEAIEDARRANRPDLEKANQEEIGFLQRYLPQPFTPQELEQLARQVIAEVGASEPKQMGQVMKVLTPRLQGRATGEQASQVVRKLLQ